METRRNHTASPSLQGMVTLDHPMGDTVRLGLTLPRHGVVDPSPIVTAPGLRQKTGTLTISSDLANTCGRPVYSFDHPRTDAALDDPFGYRALSLGRAVEYVTAIQGEPVTIVAHSAGAVDTTEMARQMVLGGQRDSIRALQLFAPLGVAKTDRASLVRHGREEIESRARQHVMDVAMDAAFGNWPGVIHKNACMQTEIDSTNSSVAAHPALAEAELHAAADQDIMVELRFLGGSQVAMNVHVVGFTDDILIPCAEVERRVATVPGVRYRSLKSGHMIDFANSRRVAEMVLALDPPYQLYSR